MIYNGHCNSAYFVTRLQFIFYDSASSVLNEPIAQPPDTTIHFLASEESRSLGDISCPFGIMQ